jgi:prevent-host-death family protein
MAVIAQKELRNDVGAVLRRVEAGETLTVTVAGRVVAELRPVHKKQWVSGAALRQVWSGPAPQSLADDLARLGAEVVDPFG